jgi:competence protein ComEA
MTNFIALVAALLFSINLAFAAPVDVNKATEKELQTLNGIGPVKAKAIVDYRLKNGPFKSVDELDKVPGIGKATVDKIRKDVTLAGNTKTPADVKSGDQKKAGSAKADTTATSSKSESSTAKADKSGTGNSKDQKGQAATTSAKKDDKKAGVPK